MTYELILGDYAYSSWSLRGWLLFEKFGIPRTTRMVDFAATDVYKQMDGFAPARLVPTMKTPEGTVVWDSLAMAEELASRHPDVAFWPADPVHRATARSVTAEMHAGFSALRSQCPMSLRAAYDWQDPSDDVRADLARLEQIWAHAKTVADHQGQWLFGDYSIADAFFAPVAARIAGFTLPVGVQAKSYVDTHLNDPAFRRWRAMGMVHGKTLDRYAQKHATLPWPGPELRTAIATDQSDSENTVCPYSGKPVTHFMEMDDRVFGFCNAFCRDKTVADPMAWPKFTALL